MQIAIVFVRVLSWSLLLGSDDGFGCVSVRFVGAGGHEKPKAAQSALDTMQKNRLGSTWRRPPANRETERVWDGVRAAVRVLVLVLVLVLVFGLLGIACQLARGQTLRAAAAQFRFRFRYRFELHNESPPSPQSKESKESWTQNAVWYAATNTHTNTHRHTWFDFFYRQFLLNSSYFLAPLQRFLLSHWEYTIYGSLSFLLFVTWLLCSLFSVLVHKYK